MIKGNKVPVNYIAADAILNDEILIRDGIVCKINGEPLTREELQNAISVRLQEDSEEDYSEQWGGF